MALGADARVVVVGAGQGGFQVAASLRDAGFAGRIVLLGDEGGLPYGRPPLSKGFMTGKTDAETIRLRPPAFFAERDIETVHGRAVAIDRTAARVELEDGERLAYDHLVLATGARNRRLSVPGEGGRDVLHLRDLDDAIRLRDRLPGTKRLIVVGAGFIGLEFASVAAERGIETTVLEATGRPMSRALSEPTAAFLSAAHRRARIDIACGAVVVGVTGNGDRATGVTLGTGEHLPADLVVAGIGVVPNTELAGAAGLPVENGVAVDAALLTADPAISAIGDCASFPSPHAGGGRIRLESVGNAVDGAKLVASRLVGGGGFFEAVPWFWSDQGPWKLQIAGIADASARTVVRTAPDGGGLTVFRFEGDRMAAVETVNRAADHMLARRLLSARAGLLPDRAGDPAVDLRAEAARILG